MKNRIPTHRAKYAVITVLALFIMACGMCSCNPGIGQIGVPNDEVETSDNDNDNDNDNNNVGSADFGDVVTAGDINASNNAPEDVRDDFTLGDDSIIYVVAEVDSIEEGTTVFSRWSRDGDVFEDSPTITAEEDYQNVFLEFHIEPIEGEFEPGDYTVQIYVNGNPGPETDFTVD
jgi:hypothetical protein